MEIALILQLIVNIFVLVVLIVEVHKLHNSMRIQAYQNFLNSYFHIGSYVMDYPDTARSITKEESDLKQREKSWMRQVFALLEHVFWLKENGIIKKEEFEETWEPLIRGTFEYKEVKPYFREEAYNRKFVDYLKEKKFI